mgnify:CR=1 FL=1
MDKQSIFSNEYSKIFIGLTDLTRAVREYATHLPIKLEAMEKIYLQKTSGYSEVEQKKIVYFREASAYKFHLANLHLEQLWSLMHVGNQSPLLKDVLRNIYDTHQFAEDSILLPSFAIEGFIIQGTAFLDFYMLYMCSIFQISETNYLSGRKFLKALQQVEQPHKARSEQVYDYFAEKVFGESNTGAILTDNWGGLLKSLRNSLVHRDTLFPDFQNENSLLIKVVGEWPEKLMNLSCSRFSQDIQNVMFYLMTELAAIVYDLEYKPGPYRLDMW